jgi:hypothetical protein
VTVISTLLSNHGTAHATDSLITKQSKDGTSKPIEFTRSKIISVVHFKGAMSYWGLAKYGTWLMYGFLQSLAARARNYHSPEPFAQYVADELTKQLKGFKIKKERDSGIGIHFTAYEHISGYWIPELFLIGNWTDPSYTAVHAAGLTVSRETYHTIAKVPPHTIHGEEQFRLQVHDFLMQHDLLFFNNGDPSMFNPPANAILNMIRIAKERGVLIEMSPKTWCAIARRPIEVVRHIQSDFYRPNTRLVGGALHDLFVSPDGTYYSTTGDY